MPWLGLNGRLVKRVGPTLNGDSSSMPSARLIAVVDDDVSLRESLDGLLTALGYIAATFSSAEALLSSSALAASDCLILDVSMPGMSGPELQGELIARKSNLPIIFIFITAQGDEVVVSRVMADGAVDCLLKPFSEASLLTAIDKAFAS